MRIPSSCHGQNEKSNLTLLLRIHPLPTLQTQHPIWYLCGDPGGPFGALLIRAMRKRRQREAERLAPRESRCLERAVSYDGQGESNTTADIIGSSLFCCSHHLASSCRRLRDLCKRTRLLRVFATASAASSSLLLLTLLRQTRCKV